MMDQREFTPMDNIEEARQYWTRLIHLPLLREEETEKYRQRLPMHAMHNREQQQQKLD